MNGGRSWFFRLLEGVFFLAAVLSLSTLYNYFRYFINVSGDATYFLLAMFLLDFLFGLMLALEHLIRERRKPGRWIFDMPRGVFLVLPSFLLSIYYFLYYSDIPYVNAAFHYLPVILSSSTYFVMLSQVFFGFFLATNFSKKD